MATNVLAGLAGSYVLYKYLDSKYNIGYDLAALPGMLPLKTVLGGAIRRGDNLIDYWERTLAKHANKPALLFENRQLTFRELDEATNQMGHWALSVGLKKGDVVALVMENRPEFVIVWLGLAKVGVQTAMINFNLKQKGLLHCIGLSKAKFVIFGAECSENMSEVADEVRDTLKSHPLSMTGKVNFADCIDEVLAAQPKSALSKSHRQGIVMTDTLAYIYTSGTTGLPKAAVIKHYKMMAFAIIFTHTFKTKDTDRVYTVLPLYHSAANMSIGSMIYNGCTVVIKRKFSAREFWKDIHDYKCTVTQYIGELARYLLNTPVSPYDKKHQLRIAIGNGLRPDIWAEFQSRFNIPEIGEFYGATEGNISLMNHCRTKEAQGAIGRMGSLAYAVVKPQIVKFDVDKEEIIRDANGFCIPCAYGEPGELLGHINPNDPITRFPGYTNEESNKKKIATNVLVKGDAYFRTGDLISRDSRGYLYFVDRIGDTFRWKGENVSTTEVAEAVTNFPGMLEANCYGVQVPGKDGRACAIAAIVRDDFDWVGFGKHVAKALPSYAQPMFLRILGNTMEITGTWKHQKVKLREDGVNPATVTDKMFWLNPATSQYEPFTAQEWQSIVAGKAKL